MSEAKFYNKDRDIMALDKAGNYYCRHVYALTRENLVSKSDIAAELGYRDMLIDEMYAMLKDIMKSNCKTSEFSEEIFGLLAKARGEL